MGFIWSIIIGIVAGYLLVRLCVEEVSGSLLI